MTKKIDGFHLKVIAIIGMFLNHMGIIFEWGHQAQTLPFFAVSEFVGRFTFPIMAYLLVEGYHYTRDVKKYALRLGIFWVLSIYPFYLMRNAGYAFSLTDIPNNIFFTLLTGLLMMVCYDKIKSPVGHFFLVVLFTLLTILSDWNVVGIPLIWAFFKYHNEKGIKVTTFVYFLIFEALSILNLVFDSRPAVYLVEIIASFGFLAVGYLLVNYNGKRGYSADWAKWGFYAFYPLHLVVLEMIKYIL